MDLPDQLARVPRLQDVCDYNPPTCRLDLFDAKFFCVVEIHDEPSDSFRFPTAVPDDLSSEWAQDLGGILALCQMGPGLWPYFAKCLSKYFDASAAPSSVKRMDFCLPAGS